MIVKSPCPVITAIGHTIDVSVCDRVADMTAITPTDAANLINPSIKELSSDYERYKNALVDKLNSLINNERLFLSECERKLISLAPKEKLKNMELKYTKYKSNLESLLNQSLLKANNNLSLYDKQLITLIKNDYTKAYQKYLDYSSMIEATSVYKTLKRGFAFVSYNGHSVKSIKDVKIGDIVETALADGKITSKVEKVKEGN